MHTITICAYNRPAYLRCVLLSLLTALQECPEYAQQVQVVIGIDPGGLRQPEVTTAALQFADIACLAGLRAAHVITWPERLGVSEHPRRLLQHVFTGLDSEFNVHLEDDTVLSPDALRLAQWYRQLAKSSSHRDQQLLDKVICLSLHSRGTDASDPAQVHRRPDFGVWGWCCPHISWWLWFSHYWNIKREGKLGFDWSVSWMMHRHELWALNPALSRVRNVGRSDGVHQTPEEYDKEMEGLVRAGSEHMQRIDSFVLTADKPARPVWEWGN